MSHAAKLLQTAITHHQAGQLAEAEKAYRKLLQLEPVNADGLRLLGGLYLQKGQWGEAIACLEKAVKRDPRNAETLVNLGLALRHAGRGGEAAEKYRQALEIDPNQLLSLNNLGSLAYENGHIDEAMRAYEQVLRLKPDYAAAHFNYANCLVAKGDIVEAVARYEHTLKLKSDYLEAMINLGTVLSQIGQRDLSRQWLQIARSWFDKALAADPHNVQAMNNIANVLRQQGQTEEAIAYYRKALALKPDYAEAAINLSTSLRDLNLLEEAIESCRLALRLQPESADARINLGTMMQDLRRHAEALQLFAEALQRKPSSIDAKWNMALSLLALGRYEEAWPLHEIGLGVAYMRGLYPAPDKRWQGDDLTGKRLLVWAEQGLGDTLQFIRCAALCKSKAVGGDVKIIVFCPRPLRSLLANCPFIDELPDTIEEKAFDLHVPMMSLPYNLGMTLDTIPVEIPYLHISAAARARWAERLQDTSCFKVGLVWAGNPREQQINAHMADKRRSMTLEMLRPLFDVEGVSFYNLQMGDKAGQIDTHGLRDRFTDLMPQVENFEDTGAIIEHLDLVISVDTSVVHLAGGMGKPVWVLSRYDACWRWLENRSDSPWYPSARIFGQPTFGDWAPVIEQVRNELEKAVQA